MNKYEAMFIINSELGEEEIKAIVEKFKTLIEAQAEVEAFAEWGKRRLAYPILDMNEGYYILTVFNANPSFPAELERVFGITEGIIRYLVLRK